MSVSNLVNAPVRLATESKEHVTNCNQEQKSIPLLAKKQQWILAGIIVAVSAVAIVLIRNSILAKQDLIRNSILAKQEWDLNFCNANERTYSIEKDNDSINCYEGSGILDDLYDYQAWKRVQQFYKDQFAKNTISESEIEQYKGLPLVHTDLHLLEKHHDWVTACVTSNSEIDKRNLGDSGSIGVQRTELRRYVSSPPTFVEKVTQEWGRCASEFLRLEHIKCNDYRLETTKNFTDRMLEIQANEEQSIEKLKNLMARIRW
jgi:hypothetical protein